MKSTGPSADAEPCPPLECHSPCIFILEGCVFKITQFPLTPKPLSRAGERGADNSLLIFSPCDYL